MLRFGKFVVFSGMICLLALSGCNDPKSASKENFKKALQVYYDAHPLIVTQIWLTLPVIEGSSAYKTNEEFVTFFASVGYLEGRDTVAEIDSVGYLEGHFARVNIKIKRPTKVWQLTEEGKKNFITTSNPLVGSVGGFRWADVQVKDVESFTEPADMMGKRVSEATYSITLVNEKPWVNQIKGKRGFAANFMYLDQIGAARKSSLVLTSDGWVDARQ